MNLAAFNGNLDDNPSFIQGQGWLLTKDLGDWEGYWPAGSDESGRSVIDRLRESGWTITSNPVLRWTGMSFRTAYIGPRPEVADCFIDPTL